MEKDVSVEVHKIVRHFMAGEPEGVSRICGGVVVVFDKSEREVAVAFEMFHYLFPAVTNHQDNLPNPHYAQGGELVVEEGLLSDLHEAFGEAVGMGRKASPFARVEDDSFHVRLLFIEV